MSNAIYKQITISLIQLDVVHKDKAANLAQLETILTRAESLGDLVLLPELFTTGYLFESPEEIHALSESLDNSKTVDALSALAGAYSVTIVAGMAERDGDQYFNTCIVVNGAGIQHSYRKLAQTNIDKCYFHRGDELVTFELNGIRFGLAICFDLWFPELIREYTRLGVDVILHPANFGGEHSLHVARSRAIENNLYVITCNRIGREHAMGIEGHYCGQSQVIGPEGDVLMRLASDSALKNTVINGQGNEVKAVIGVRLLDEINVLTHVIQGQD